MGNTLFLSREPARTANFRNPSADDEPIQMHIADRDLSLLKLKFLIKGDTGQSVTCTVKHGPDITLAGTEIETGGFTITANSTPETFNAPFSSGDFAEDDILWAEISSVAGNVESFSITASF